MNPRRPPITGATRRQILDLLAEGRLSGREIADVANVSEAMVRKVKKAGPGGGPSRPGPRTARQQLAATNAVLAAAVGTVPSPPTPPAVDPPGDDFMAFANGEFDARAVVGRLLPFSLQAAEEMIRSRTTSPRVRVELIKMVTNWAIASADTRVRAGAELAAADGMARVIADAIAPLSDAEQERLEIRRAAAAALVEARQGLITHSNE